MRTGMLYWPWQWTARVWFRMAGSAGFIVAWFALLPLLRVLREMPTLAPHAATIVFTLFFVNGVIAVVWALNTIFIAQSEALKR